MKRVVRIALAALVVALLAAQAIPVTRDNPAIEAKLETPPAIEAVLRRSCFDCHSHETRWPWYSRVAPMSWLVANHVHEGRAELNFSRWGALPAEKQQKKLAKTREEIREGEMPLFSYVLGHPEARLSAADRSLLLEWLQTAGAGAPGPADAEREHRD